jgi:hypothetical protein
MASFMDYYEDEVNKRRSSTPTRAPKKSGVSLSSLKPGGVNEPEKEAPQSPINWILDMLSRGTYGIGNVQKKAIDQQAVSAKKFQEGDVLGGAVEFVKGIPNINPLLGPFANQDFNEAFFNPTNDPELKRTNADNLEYASDKFGGTLTPNTYEDTEDNVNPWVKGIAGLAMDIGTDPLTYVSGTGLLKGAQGIGKSIKAATGAVKGARAAKPVEEVAEIAERVAQPAKASKTEDLVDENPFEGVTTLDPGPAITATKSPIDEILTPRAPRIVDAPVVKPAPTQQAAETVVEALTKGQTLSKAIAASPKTPGLKAEVENLKSVFTQAAVPAPVKSAEEFDPRAWVKANPDAKVYVNLPGDGRATSHTVSQLVNIAKAFAGQPRGIAAGKAVGMAAHQVGRDLAESAKAPVDAIVAGVQAVHNRIAQGGNDLRNILGDDLVDLLATKTSQHGMARTLTKLDSIFDGRIKDLDRFAESNPRLTDAVSPIFRQETKAVKAAPNTPESVEALATQLTELSPVSKVMASVFRGENLPGTPEFLAKYGKIAKSNPVAKAGDETADWWRKTNTFTQMSILKKLETYIGERVQSVTGTGLKGNAAELGRPRAAARREAIETLGDEITDSMETFGTPLHIGVADDLVRLTFPDVYRMVGQSMDELFGSADVTNLALHNYGTAIAPSRFLNVVQHAIVHPESTVDELAAYIRKTTVDSAGPNAGKKLENNIIGTFKGGAPGHGFHYLGQSSAAAKKLSNLTGGALKAGSNGGRFIFYNKGGNLPEMLAQAIAAARGPLAVTAEENAAAWAARGISEAQQLTGGELAALRRIATNESKAAQREFAASVARRKDEIAKQAAAQAATPEGTQAAVLATEAAIGDDVLNEVSTVAAQERHLKEGSTLEDAGDAAMLDRYNDAEKGDIRELLNQGHNEAFLATKIDPGMAPEQAVKILDIGELAHAKIQWATTGALGERLNKMFNRNYGLTGTNRDLLLKSGNAAGRFVADAVVKPVRDLARTFNQETLQGALRAVQQGTKIDPATPLGQATAAIEDVVGKLFDTDVTHQSAMGNIFTESGAGLEQINATLRWAYGSNTGIQLYRPLAQKTAKEALGPRATKAELKARTDFELREQWRAWDFGGDPADALVRLGQAAGRVAEHRATVASFVSEGMKNGWAVKVPKGEAVPAGFVKIVDSTGTSSFKGILPKNVYISEAIAPELARLDFLTTVSRQLSGEVGDFVRGTLVPMTNTWKQGMTIYRLGHHIRNAIGNLSLQFVERGTRSMHESNRAAWQLIAMRNNFEGLDAIAALRGMGDNAVPRSGDKLFTTSRYGDFSNEEVWAYANKEGLLPTYAASEGLLSGEVREQALMSRILKPIDAANNPVGRLGAATSQNLDHFQRLHHFVQILMQEGSKRGGKWEGTALSRDQLIKKAAEEVRKLHPDSSMLTATENKYMKLAIPFYTWMRGVLPGAFESAMTHPGRLMTFPKASYNIAVAAGLNPDSLADPFPEDQLFPSFIKEAALGPQFQIGSSYLRVNPGIAHLDLAQSFGPEPIRGVAGMVNPLVRIPAELLSGGSWGTGSQINDWSDYLDQSLPGVNYLANISGVSPTGSVESVLSGQGLDQQAQAVKGDKTDLDKWLSVANWITGLGAQNLSRPNYINYAEIEKRNAASEK